MKLMLDECMPAKASHLLIELLKLSKPPIEAAYLEDYLHAKGGLDVEWARLLAEEGGWIVVTCDSGRARGEVARLKGPPLHLILPARQITGFYMSSRIAQASGFEKIRAIVYLLPEIRKFAESYAPGGRFRIHPHTTGYAVRPWPVTQSLPPSTSDSSTPD